MTSRWNGKNNTIPLNEHILSVPDSPYNIPGSLHTSPKKVESQLHSQNTHKKQPYPQKDQRLYDKLQQSPSLNQHTTPTRRNDPENTTGISRNLHTENFIASRSANPYSINDGGSPIITRSSSRKRLENNKKPNAPLPIPRQTGTEYSVLATTPHKTTKTFPNSNTVTTHLAPPSKIATSTPSNVCAVCNKVINTKSVKALGKIYHADCFGCADCGTPILSKYFPFETDDGKKIPLCEKHFYGRRGLVCCVCNDFLTGTHYTVFGRKYDAEHFCCKICSKKFESDEDFFNNDGSIYCHYHFSKFFSHRCEGCEYAILKKYVEIFRGGKNQKWHVECYMIHKFWNVHVTLSSMGFRSFPKLIPNDQNINSANDINPTPAELIQMEKKTNEKITDIWNILFKLEEDSAACISKMLFYATQNDQENGLITTGKLVVKIDALLKAIDSIHRLGIDTNYTKSSHKQNFITNDQVNYQKLSKEPRNLTAKIMNYLAILRKISKGASASTQLQDQILSVVTGLAHYLKLLIRYGLNNSLEYNKESHTTSALDKFLREVRNHEITRDDPLSGLDVPVNASDLCFHCNKSIDSECAQYQDKRWHVDCLHCKNCNKNLNAFDGVADASFNSNNNSVLCAQCAVSDPDAKPGFKAVSKLLQLSYLLKLSIVRSKTVMDYEKANGLNTSKIVTTNESQELEQGYRKTLSDIKRLRSTRQNTRISDTKSKENARKSMVIETNDQELESPVKSDNYNASLQLIPKRRITVQDEPIGPSLSKTSFNRATNIMNDQDVLTLDDIPRIVAAEHARELRPNTFKFHNPHQAPAVSQGIKQSHTNAALPSVTETIKSNDPNEPNYEKKVRYYSELNDQESFLINHISIVVLRQLLLKNNLAEGLDIGKLLDNKKNASFWDKVKAIYTHGKNTNSLQKVFGSELKELTIETGVQSTRTNGPSKVRIPMLIEDLLAAMSQKDMSTEGIFRKNGNLRTLKELTQQIDSNPSKIPNLEDENAVQLSALLKKFLRDMPTPLLTFKLYDLWILSQKANNNILKQLIIELSYSLLPKYHRDLTEVLLLFFMWVSSFSHLDEQTGSKMDTHNLATVLSPNILYVKPTEIVRPSQKGKEGVVAATYYEAFGENEGENYYLAIEVVGYLIEHHEELSIIPGYLIEIFDLCKFDKIEKIDQYTSKDLFNKIEQVLKENISILKGIGTEATKNEEFTRKASVVEKTDNQQFLRTSVEN